MRTAAGSVGDEDSTPTGTGAVRPAASRRSVATTSVAATGLVAVELLVWDGDLSSRWGGTWPVVTLLGVAAVGAVASVATWRWPFASAAIVWATSLVAVPVPSWQPFGAVLVTLYVLARTLPTDAARLVLALALVPLGVNAWNSTEFTGPVTPGTLLPVAGIWLLVAVAVYAAGRAGHRSARRVDDLEATILHTERTVREEERRRIARDLHDSVAHSVTAMVLRAAGARSAAAAAGDPRVVEALGDVEQSGAQAVRELHRLLHTMHGTSLDDAHPRRPGLADVGELVERTRAAGLVVEVVETGPRPPLDASVDVAAYRCVQEALSNAMRHGGAGTRVVVTIGGGETLDIEVVSSPPTSRSGHRPVGGAGGFGLVGLSERLAAVGGTLDVGPTSEGYRLVARLPVARAEVTS